MMCCRTVALAVLHDRNPADDAYIAWPGQCSTRRAPTLAAVPAAVKSGPAAEAGTCRPVADAVPGVMLRCCNTRRAASTSGRCGSPPSAPTSCGGRTSRPFGGRSSPRWASSASSSRPLSRCDRLVSSDSQSSSQIHPGTGAFALAKAQSCTSQSLFCVSKV